LDADPQCSSPAEAKKPWCDRDGNPAASHLHASSHSRAYSRYYPEEAGARQEKTLAQTAETGAESKGGSSPSSSAAPQTAAHHAALKQ